MRLGGLIIGAAALLLTACGGDKAALTPVFHAQGNPQTLSEWQVFSVDGAKLALAEGTISYDLASPLFSDYAHKLRTVWMPEGTAATYNANDVFDFPVGTIITKTFYYPNSGQAASSVVLNTNDDTASRVNAGFDLTDVTLIETRLLVHRDAGWAALPYVWNAEQSKASLKRTGDIKPLTLINIDGSQSPFSYVVPNVNQCAGCHAENATTKELRPIGPKARHLNRIYRYPSGAKNQLTEWTQAGRLIGAPEAKTAPRNVDWNNIKESLDARARAYLDINCSHCHNANGPADTSGLLLEASSPDGVSLGRCKRPIAAGTGTGGHSFDIVPGQPEHSIFPYRLGSTNPAEMMPELGRSLAHDEGVALITAWIEAMDGDCG